MPNFGNVKRLLTIILVVGALSSSGQGIFHYYSGIVNPKPGAPPRVDRLFVDLFYTGWETAPEGIDVDPWSHGVNVSLVYDISFGKLPVGIGVGGSFTSFNVHHNGRIVNELDPSTGEIYTNLVPLPDDYDYRRNKLSTNYLEVPFELRFRSRKKEDGLRFYPGFRAGWLVNIHTTTVDNDGKFKNYNFENLVKYQYGATLRIAYKNIAFNGYYALTPIFEENKGVFLRPFSIGFTIFMF